MKTTVAHRSSTHSLPCRIGFTVLFLLAIHQTVHAQTGSNLEASVIAGGGNGNGTVGQWGVGTLTSGGSLARPTLSGGFWNAEEVPWLRLERNAGSLLIAWPASFLGFQLEQSSTVGTGATWGSVSQTVNVVNGENQITMPIGPSPRFFRLQKP